MNLNVSKFSDFLIRLSKISFMKIDDLLKFTELQIKFEIIFFKKKLLKNPQNHHQNFPQTPQTQHLSNELLSLIRGSYQDIQSKCLKIYLCF